jgi:hypothetical protein
MQLTYTDMSRCQSAFDSVFRRLKMLKAVRLKAKGLDLTPIAKTILSDKTRCQ